MQIKSWAIVVLLLISIFLAKHMILPLNQKLKIVLVMPPTSVDPMDYDYSIHHNTMRSVFASLVSAYKSGEYAPQVAKNWKTNADQTEWKLEINQDWTFENGDLVTPEIVLRNFKRVLLIKNQSNSKSGLLEYVVGAETLYSLEDDIQGLKATKNEIVFLFTKPMPDFLGKISFGLYSIAHPNDYDEKGKWKDKKHGIPSGHYKITRWDDKKMSLKLRTNLKTGKITNKNIHEVDFIYPDDLSEVEDAKMIFSDRLNPKIDENKWSFASSTLDNKIIYIQVMKWDEPNSIYSVKENRKKLRDVFYASLQKAGMEPMTSFFPLSIKGVTRFTFDKDHFDLGQRKVATQPFTTTDYKVSQRKKTQGDIFSEAYYDFCLSINATPQINNYPSSLEDEKKVFDIQYLGTGVSIDDPKEDIRFMFKSKHGIMLPDESGEILKLLDNDFNVQDINKELWEQAIIWPLKHYSSGFWYRNDSDLDISELNLLLTPMDLQFLRWK